VLIAMSVCADDPTVVDPRKMLAHMLLGHQPKLPTSQHDKVHKNVCEPILEIVAWCLDHDTDIQDMHLYFSI
jgi:hypothetical protein